MNREPSLDELLDEPIVRLIMRRDGVEARELRALVEAMRRRMTTQSGCGGLVGHRD